MTTSPSNSRHVKGVIDMTFLDIKDENGIASNLDSNNPNILQVTSVIDGTSSSGNNNPTSTTGSPSRKKKEEEIKALRLSNNLITDMNILYNPFKSYPSINCASILWLDLSFNQVSIINDSLPSLFPNLTTLYLHANCVKKVSEVKKLASMEHLKSLSLYGNPVEGHKHYRNYVLFLCKHLTQFDSSPVTKVDRERVEIWSRTFRRFLNPDEY